MNPALELGRILKEQNWDESEMLTALIMQFAGLAYALNVPPEEACAVCEQAVAQIYETMDAMMGSRTLQ